MLAEFGVRVNTDWRNSILQHYHDQEQHTIRHDHPGDPDLYIQFLHSHLKDSADPSLPPQMDRIHNEVLSGPFVLQANDILDISLSAQQRSDHVGITSSKRVIKLTLTDGQTNVFGIEHCRIEKFGSHLNKGGKILVMNVAVWKGTLLLTPKNTAVLGGSVPSSAVQQQSDNLASTVSQTQDQPCQNQSQDQQQYQQQYQQPQHQPHNQPQHQPQHQLQQRQQPEQHQQPQLHQRQNQQRQCQPQQYQQQQQQQKQQPQLQQHHYQQRKLKLKKSRGRKLNFDAQNRTPPNNNLHISTCSEYNSSSNRGPGMRTHTSSHQTYLQQQQWQQSHNDKVAVTATHGQSTKAEYDQVDEEIALELEMERDMNQHDQLSKPGNEIGRGTSTAQKEPLSDISSKRRDSNKQEGSTTTTIRTTSSKSISSTSTINMQSSVLNFHPPRSQSQTRVVSRPSQLTVQDHKSDSNEPQQHQSQRLQHLRLSTHLSPTSAPESDADPSVGHLFHGSSPETERRSPTPTSAPTSASALTSINALAPVSIGESLDQKLRQTQNSDRLTGESLDDSQVADNGVGAVYECADEESKSGLPVRSVKSHKNRGRAEKSSESEGQYDNDNEKDKNKEKEKRNDKRTTSESPPCKRQRCGHAVNKSSACLAQGQQRECGRNPPTTLLLQRGIDSMKRRNVEQDDVEVQAYVQSVVSFEFSKKEYDLKLKLDDSNCVFRAKMDTPLVEQMVGMTCKQLKAKKKKAKKSAEVAEELANRMLLVQHALSCYEGVLRLRLTILPADEVDVVIVGRRPPSFCDFQHLIKR